MSDFLEYFTKINCGEIMACEKMKRISEILLKRYENPKEFHFDEDIAKRHISFIEKFCKVPSGRLGEPLRLELFQKARLEALFGFVDDNNLRQYNECLIIEGRKNGKTTEIAAIELDMLINDGEGSPQIYNVATKREQANLGFNAAHKMVKLDKFLSKHIRKRSSDLYFSRNFGTIKALASNANSLDGLDTHCGVIDELAAIKNRDLYDLVKQSFGSRKQPLLFTITTNGFVRDGIFDSQYDYAKNILNMNAKDERFLPFIYELDSIDEWDKPECWIKANPGLGTIKSEKYLAEMVEKAKKDISFKPTVLVKDFNIPQTDSNAWLTFEEVSNEEHIPEYKFKYAIGGIDAADSVDLNAATAIFMRPNDDKIYKKSMYWVPQSVIDESRQKGDRKGRDNVPYDLWISQGIMRAYPGQKVDKKVFLDWFTELRDEEDLYLLYIGYDPWHIDDSLLRQFEFEFGKNTMISVRQGAKTLSAPMKELKADLRQKRIVNNNNPIDKWCLINMNIKMDINGNIQPVKGKDQRNRIDGGVALINAYKVLIDKFDEYTALI